MNNEAHREFRITPETIFTEVDTEDVIFQGERLTDARADQIVDDVRRANLVPGGKSLNGDGSHSRAISVRLPDSTRDALDSVADARGISSSKLVRQVLDDFLARTSDVDGSVNETTLKRRASRAVAGKHSKATGARKRSVAASNRRRRKSA